jgi:hypothetical protein
MVLIGGITVLLSILGGEENMEVSDRQPRKVREIAETLDPEELRRAAHKIAWTRMNGSLEAANPFVKADQNRRAPGDGTNRTSRHR